MRRLAHIIVAALLLTGPAFGQSNNPSPGFVSGVLGVANGGTAATSSPLALIGRQTFCASGCTATGGTYTPTTGTKEIDVQCVGGGAAGGGSASTAAGNVSAGGGGGGAAYVRQRFTAAFSGVTVTIGAAGSGVANNTGNSGGITTFGALLTALNGAGGAAGVSATAGAVSGGSGGVASGGDLNISGQPGAQAAYLSVATAASGYGGNSALGSGAAPTVTTGTSTGIAGTGFGSGGSGGANGPSQAGTTTGGAGAAGICVVDEYR